MTDRQLQVLQLEPERVQRAADFFESYADSTERRSEDLSAASWAVQVDVATSLRVAGQWAMFFDVERARNLLVRSGLILHNLGHGFGTFLLTGMSAEGPDRRQLAARLSGVAALQGTDAGHASGDLPEPLLHPQQQAYLFVAGSGMNRTESSDTSYARIAEPTGFTRQLRTLAESPHRNGVLAVGSLGTPIRIYWNIASLLLEREPRASERIVYHLIGMAQRYGQSIDLAMANERLWFNGAAPVDVGDIDVVCLALVAARSLGVGRFRDALGRAEGQLSPYSSVIIEAAAEMMP